VLDVQLLAYRIYPLVRGFQQRSIRVLTSSDGEALESQTATDENNGHRGASMDDDLFVVGWGVRALRGEPSPA